MPKPKNYERFSANELSTISEIFNAFGKTPALNALLDKPYNQEASILKMSELQNKVYNTPLLSTDQIVFNHVLETPCIDIVTAPNPLEITNVNKRDAISTTRKVTVKADLQGLECDYLSVNGRVSGGLPLVDSKVLQINLTTQVVVDRNNSYSRYYPSTPTAHAYHADSTIRLSVGEAELLCAALIYNLKKLRGTASENIVYDNENIIEEKVGPSV